MREHIWDSHNKEIPLTIVIQDLPTDNRFELIGEAAINFRIPQIGEHVNIYSGLHGDGYVKGEVRMVATDLDFGEQGPTNTVFITVS